MSRAIGLLLVAGGCGGGTLPDESYLDRSRVLAARIDAGGHSEVVPGEIATVEVLAWAPDGEPQVLVTLCTLAAPAPACPSDELLSGAKEQDFSAESGADWARQNGVMGVLPNLPVDIRAPELAGPNAAAGRMYLSLGFAAWADGMDDERAQSTLVVVDGRADRNLNPGPPGLRVDDATAGEELRLTAGSTVRLEAIAAGPAETWTTPDDTATERFSYRWYSDIGDLAPRRPGVPALADDERDEVDWVLPERPSDGALYLVARDGRGGMSWSAFQVVVQ